MAPVAAARTIALFALVVLAACRGGFGQPHESFHQTIPASDAPTVHVENLVGAIRIKAWDKPSVDVKATKYGRDAADLRAITISIHSEGDGIFIATKVSGTTHGGVRYTIRVPATASLDIKNSVGTVAVAGVRGDVTVETQTGAITADLGKVDGARAIALRAVTGAVRLSIARDSNASIVAHSDGGEFSSNTPSLSKSRENLVGAGASGRIGSGSARIRLSTVTGAIKLTVRSESKARSSH